jgi:hypothetical protein
MDSIKKHLNGTDENTDDIGRLYDLSSNDIILIHDHPDTTELFFEAIDYFLKENVTFLLPAAD